MDLYTFIVIGMIVGYMIGSIPFALVVGKVFYKVDVRKYGSGNLGSTNVARTLGAIPGAICLILDTLKGGLTAFIIFNIAKNYISNDPSLMYQIPYLPVVYCATGLMACLGHCHPMFANFRGGKAVATIFGFLIFCNYKLAIVAGVTYIVLIIITKIVSLGSISGAILALTLSFIPFFKECYLFNVVDSSAADYAKASSFIFSITLFFMAAILIIRHLSNIERLLKGEEKKFHFEKLYKKEQKEETK